MVRQTLDRLGDASNQMRTTLRGLVGGLQPDQRRVVQIAERASGEASVSVESVASASQELSASIDDISRQASHAAGIAGRAVNRARETDDTVQGLAKTATRIGEVVGLINSIAAQTNLLALNPTIEPARAGEAGRGLPWWRPRSNHWPARPPRRPTTSPGADCRHSEGRSRGH